jgi:hypothetical protein
MRSATGSHWTAADCRTPRRAARALAAHSESRRLVLSALSPRGPGPAGLSGRGVGVLRLLRRQARSASSSRSDTVTQNTSWSWRGLAAARPGLTLAAARSHSRPAGSCSAARAWQEDSAALGRRAPGQLHGALWASAMGLSFKLAPSGSWPQADLPCGRDSRVGLGTAACLTQASPRLRVTANLKLTSQRYMH